MISDTWECGNPYELYIGRWSRQIAPRFLSWLNCPTGKDWVDVGCGTGALCAAIVDRCAPSSVTGIEPSEGFLKAAKDNLAARARFYQGTATAIPLDNTSADVVVSGLVLNFIADQQAALAEMARLTRRGGTIAAYVWDYAEKMELIRYFWDAAIALNPGDTDKDEGIRFPMCRPEPLQRLFVDAGLQNIDVAPIDIPTPFANFDDFWQPFLGGQGPAPAYTMSLDETARTRLRNHLRECLPKTESDSISLIARAWAIRATVAE